MAQMNLSPEELDIIRLLRQLVPYEEIRVSKGKDGRPDCYFVLRTQKIVIDKAESGAIPM